MAGCGKSINSAAALALALDLKLGVFEDEDADRGGQRSNLPPPSNRRLDPHAPVDSVYEAADGHAFELSNELEPLPDRQFDSHASDLIADPDAVMVIGL